MSRRYASIVAGLRPFSMLSHCKYSVAGDLVVVKESPKDTVQCNDE